MTKAPFLKGVLLENNNADINETRDPAYTVVKRNGTLVPFKKERILNAIVAAFRSIKHVPAPKDFDTDLQEKIDLIVNSVVNEVLHLAARGASLTVEGIQDIVEVTLMKNDAHDVARGYILYRDSREASRACSSRHLKIYRRDKTTPVRFNPMKIAASIERAFFRLNSHQDPVEVTNAVNLLTKNIVEEMLGMAGKNDPLYIDMVEDRIERGLMFEGYFDAAKQYILHRAEKARQQAMLQPVHKLSNASGTIREFSVKTADAGNIVMNELMLRSKIAYACREFELMVSVDELLEMAITQFYVGITEREVDLANIFAAKSKIEKEPIYSQIAARLLLDVIYREVVGISASDSKLSQEHRRYFKKYIKTAISLEQLDPRLLDFDLDELSAAIDLNRDNLFDYLGLQTLYDRYFIHKEQKRLETPQIFWMRVAMGLSLNEGAQKNKCAVEFYNTLSKFYYVSSTATLFNSGTRHPQLSSCYLLTVMDDLHHIFKTISDDAQLSKWSGGIGNDWTNVRATGAQIKGTNGTSQGVIPFLKIANDTAVAVNQCLSPETLVYTARGALPISEVRVKDLVLGVSGTYREVIDTFSYNQKDSMVSISTNHSLKPLLITAGHPLLASRDPSIKNQKPYNSQDLHIQYKTEWIDAGQLQIGDYIALTIPKETVLVPFFSEEDARMYGVAVVSGAFARQNGEWNISINATRKENLDFVRNYLTQRGIVFREEKKNFENIQIYWNARANVTRNATTDEIISSNEQEVPFNEEDIYNLSNQKCIAPRLSHLPFNQTLALLQGAVINSEYLEDGNQIILKHDSVLLVESIRYQLLRLGILTTGNHNDLTSLYELRVPCLEKIKIDRDSDEKTNWLDLKGHLFTRITNLHTVNPVPFVYDLKVEGDESYMTTVGLAHNGGKRRGAMCAYLESWHLDIEDFLELRKNTGDERRRTHDMNTANWIPDLFLKRVREQKSWTLFSPNDVPDLHGLYGSAFEKKYVWYEKQVEEGKLKLYKKVEAVNLWRKMLSMLFETGHPWITFKDPSNIRSSQDHVGSIHSSNLCTEILLNTSSEETAVCNLGSINLVKHVTEKGLDESQLANTVRTAIRMLDNVIDINFYPTIEARRSNLRHRPIGLGFMGFQDALYIQNISYASHEAVTFADKSMEAISYYAILASTELARERGCYSTYEGSKWQRGLLPIDTLDLLEQERGIALDLDRSTSMDWSIVRSAVAKNGMRNSTTMAIAPTATIGNIIGVTQSNEPTYKHLFVKSNLSGEFTVINPYLVNRLKDLNLWDEEMIDDLKYFDGTIRDIERIPNEIKKLFFTAFEIEPEWILECAARRQKWIDMGQSLNLYLSEPSGKKLHQMYMSAWEKGLKTCYYLRTLGATQIEKSTVDINKRGLQPRWMKNKSASSNIEVMRDEINLKICNLDEGCESCQ